ncbi:DNA cytosine methyltransferase [Burkholderia oklahomensis]|uniref:DNA cytosine methyltransferase n=1 Tax=Burkholderia oklahomensis TaxID=342113 RepID=UPI00016A9790|nr:DNA cytosine methyltransferase [Burkholderia oklahomensis]AJX31624.1 DNA (cytosine-5-)-methyltransferase family protein [Burkholderia oklahomensis C6786]MBI0359528.1 DNA cytosine methyltransferase [Burkholderia oklahomensis]SUW58698.1 Modification methylase HhaI [Burkholderia oklahomensis]
MYSFYEFFAGGGMARAGLGSDWECQFANDFDSKKAISYAANWGDDHLNSDDVAALSTADLPGHVDLAWASFPCQDLSLAGAGAGLKGDRSGTFRPFWKLVKALGEEDRAPRMVVLENVCGALSSHDGKDFAAISAALSNGGYRFGAVVMNAIHFLPQSRPRLFVIGVRKSFPVPRNLIAGGPDGEWHPPALVEAYGKLSKRSQSSWVWWNVPAPPVRTSIFADLVEDEPHGVTWHTAGETERLLELMNPLNRAKVEVAKKARRRMVGTIYRRTRADGPKGQKTQRAEIRFDDVAGCLRTPTGGSSRQTIMVIDGESVRSRLLSPREAARLMGLPDTYLLPANYNDAYHLAGDGVVVPVVRFLAEHILEPLLSATLAIERKAA